MQAPSILATLLGRFEVELDASMGSLEGMLERQCNAFTLYIDQVRPGLREAGLHVSQHCELALLCLLLYVAP